MHSLAKRERSEKDYVWAVIMMFSDELCIFQVGRKYDCFAILNFKKKGFCGDLDIGM